MKLSARRIVLLILSILVLGLGLYNIISVTVELPYLRAVILEIFSDPQISSVFPHPEAVVSVFVGVAVSFACIGAAFYFATGILGLLASLGKYKGNAHVVLTWIYLVLCGLGFIINISELIKYAQFDWTIILNAFEVAVAITFIVIAKQIKEEEN